MERRDMTDFLLKVEEMTRSGLKYTKDEYARDNYRQLQKLVKDFLLLDDITINGENLFHRNVYPTPNVSVRAIVLSQDRKEVLMVQEKLDSLWSFPGGWCELSLSPSESCLKELREEGGYEGKILRLVACLDRYRGIPTRGIPEYVLAFEVVPVVDLEKICFEVLGRKFFPVDNLPPFSRKNDEKGMRRILQAALEQKTIFD